MDLLQVGSFLIYDDCSVIYVLLCYPLYVNPCDLSTPCVYDVDNHATFGQYMMGVLPACNTLCSGCITLIISVPTLDGYQRLLDPYSTYVSFGIYLSLSSIAQQL